MSLWHVLLFAAAIAAVYFVVGKHDKRLKAAAQQDSLRLKREVAYVEETSKLTELGGLSLVLTMIGVVVSVGVLLLAANVLQQIAAGVGLIASILFFGLGAALLRRKTYRVFRVYQAPAIPPAAARAAETPLSSLAKTQ